MQYNDDSYSGIANRTLTVAAPGALANDTEVDGDSLTAVLASAPTNGTLNLSASGAFSYAPATNFTGTDTFTYKANDGQTNSNTATVTLSIMPVGTIFYDNFTRGTDPGPLSLWIGQSGAWTVTGGVLRGGTNTGSSYGFTSITNGWANY